MKKFDGTIIITEHFDIHQDWEIPIPGFFIMASKRKIDSIADFNNGEIREFTELLCKLRRGMKDVLGIENVYLFQREDTESGFHLWVFPRFDWMERFGKKVESVRPIIDYANEKFKDGKNQEEISDMVKKIKKYMEK